MLIKQRSTQEGFPHRKLTWLTGTSPPLKTYISYTEPVDFPTSAMFAASREGLKLSESQNGSSLTSQDSVYSNKTTCFQSVCCYILLLFPLLQVDSKHCRWNPCESSQALKTPHKTLAMVHSELVSHHPTQIIKVNFDMLSMLFAQKILN